MNRSFWPICIMIACCLLCCSACKQTREWQAPQGGNEYRLGKYRLKAESTGDFVQQSFMLVGPASQSDAPLNLRIFGIPMQQVEKLQKRYGNFLSCKGIGASAGKAAVQIIALVAANEWAYKQLQDVRSASQGTKNPVVQLNMAPLKVLSINERDPRRWGNVLDNLHLVESAAVLQSDLKLQ